MLQLNRFIKEPGHSFHECQVLVGSLVSASRLIPMGMLYARRIMRWSSRLRMDPKRDRERYVLVPQRLHPDMRYWLHALGHGLTVPMGPPEPKSVSVFTDASRSG